MARWIAVALVILLLLVGVGGYAVANLDDALNENRDWLAEQVEAAIGRPVAFEAVGVSLWGGLGVRVDALRVGEDPAFAAEGAPDFLVARHARVRVALLPALRGHIEVQRVILEEPQLHVVVRESGRNLDSLGDGTRSEPGESGRAESQPADDDAADEQAPPALPAIALAEIRDGRLRYVDETVSPPAALEIAKLHVALSDLEADVPLRIELEAALAGEERNVRVSGTVGPIDTATPFETPFALDLALSRIRLDGIAAVPAIASALPEDVALSGPLDLEAKLTGTADDWHAEGRLDLTAAALARDPSFRKPAGDPLALDFEAAGDARGVRLEPSPLALGPGAFTLAAERDDTGLAFHLRGNDVPLGGWEALLPAVAERALGGRIDLDLRARADEGAADLALTGEAVLRQVAASLGPEQQLRELAGRLRLDGLGVSLEGARFELAGTGVHLDAHVPDRRTPKARFTLRAPSLLLSAAGLADPEARETEVLRELEVEGTLSLAEDTPALRARVSTGAGIVRDLPFEALKANVTHGGGRTTLDDLALRAFEGSLAGSARHRSSEGAPSFSLGARIAGIDLPRLLAARGQSGDTLTGRLQGRLQLSGAGADWAAIRPGLGGDGTLQLTDGVLHDVNLAESVLGKLTGIAGLSNLLSSDLRAQYPGIFGTGDTIFEQLDTRFEIGGGRVDVSALTLRAPDYAIDASGTITLEGAADLDARLTTSTRLTRSLIDEVRQVRYLANRGGRLEVPFRVGGTVPDVSAQPDSRFVAQALQRAAVQGLIDRALGDDDEERDAEGGEGEAARREPERERDSTERLIEEGLEILLDRNRR